MNREQKCLILTLFQLQNGNRKLSEFTDIGEYPDCFISELVLNTMTTPILCHDYYWFIFTEEGIVRWDNARRCSWSFPILDYISFEDKV